MISAVPCNSLAKEEAWALTRDLLNYYSASPEPYYAIAEQGNTDYSPRVLPFHADLVGRVRPGMSVLEVGCGSGHLCRHVQQAGGRYTGMDFGVELLQKNRERFPKARFVPIGTELHETFDLVTSLYTIEHVVDPPAYLKAMWRSCKPGGLLAVISPDFVDGDGYPPSFFYGTTPRRIRSKIRDMAFSDVIQHFLDLFWSAPRWKMRARASAPGAFWINRKPRILHGAEYSVDADAVHLPRLRDLIWWLEQEGASILRTSQSMADIDPALLRHNCYVVARTRSSLSQETIREKEGT